MEILHNCCFISWPKYLLGQKQMHDLAVTVEACGGFKSHQCQQLLTAPPFLKVIQNKSGSPKLEKNCTSALVHQFKGLKDHIFCLFVCLFFFSLLETTEINFAYTKMEIICQ